MGASGSEAIHESYFTSLRNTRAYRSSDCPATTPTWFCHPAGFAVQNPVPSLEVAMEDIGWTDCPDVERVPGRVSGQWVVKDTRILTQGVVENADAGVTPEEIGDEIFDGLGTDRARRIIEYARTHVAHPHPAWPEVDT
jgi:uncharacterized protein (DUF433 family)